MNNKMLPIADDIFDRLKSELQIKTDKGLSERMSRGENAVATWRKRGTVPFEELVELAVKEGFSLDWVMFGEGERRRSGAVAEARQGYQAGPGVASRERMIARLMAIEAEVAEAVAESGSVAARDRQDLIAQFAKLYDLEREAVIRLVGIFHD